MEQIELGNISKTLTKEVIERAFKVKTCSDDLVKSVVVSRASPAGEGLIAAVYRLEVEGATHKASFVVKGLCEDKLLRKSLDCERFSKREVKFFAEILPVLVEAQKSAGAKENIQHNLPICYATYCDGVNDYILMEDLRETGCKSLAEDLTEEESEKGLKALAHLHAVSIVLRVNNSKTFNKIARNLPDIYYREELRDWYANYMKKAVEIDRVALAEFEDVQSVYYKKFLELISGDIYGQLIELTSQDKPVRAFLHGDPWCPNYFVSEARVVMLDFQLFRCSTVVADIANYIMVNCSHLLKSWRDFDDAVQKYYNSLAFYLEDMGVNAREVFSIKDLKDEVKKYGRIGLLAALTSIPLRASAETADVLGSFSSKFEGLERIPLEELWRLRPLQDEAHKMRLVNVVRVAVDYGLI